MEVMWLFAQNFSKKKKGKELPIFFETSLTSNLRTNFVPLIKTERLFYYCFSNKCKFWVFNSWLTCTNLTIIITKIEVYVRPIDCFLDYNAQFANITEKNNLKLLKINDFLSIGHL